MAPDHDNTHKTADKTNQQDNKQQQQHTSVSKLNDGELKALLDEAITYKNPKDREGKSALFKDLLLEAEENERNARAASAGGSELVRYCNPSAKRHGRNRRSETSNGGCSSISENVTHGGSLNNLTKEELYETVSHSNRQRKTVSARQREGGSLPCDVNVGVSVVDRSFLEEAVKKSKQQQKKRECTTIDMETESLLEHDSLNRDYGGSEQQKDSTEIVSARIPRIPVKYMSSTTLHIGDDGITLSSLDSNMDKTNESSNACDAIVQQQQQRSLNTNYNVLISGSGLFNRREIEDKKVDENGNALGQNTTDTKKSKKKKIQTEKNVVVTEAKYVAGHRGDIIHDVDKLMEFIGGTENNNNNNNNNNSTGTKPKSNVHKSKLHKHVSNAEDGKSAKKKRAGSSKGKTVTTTTTVVSLKKSNSLDEMSSSAKLEDLVTNNNNNNSNEGGKVALRSNKSGVNRTWERRSWGNTEQFNAASIENLENAEFRVVTKKKKSKKRRNSISGQHQTNDFNRVHSPELRLRRPTACSVPHSEKSNDSSDVDSVRSLPCDGTTDENLPISYADIAKTADKPKATFNNNNNNKQIKKVPISTQTSPKLIVPPDVHNMENFPTIQQNTATIQNNNNKVNKNGTRRVNKTVTTTTTGKQNGEQQHAYLQNIQGDLQPMPPNITDVRTIEKMHFAQIQEQQQNNNYCDNSARTNNNNNNNRPAVVILSGETKEVSGLVFGFEINEKLLSDDVCDNFMSRFVLPVKLNTSTYNHDKIVSFIGQAWEDIVNNQTNGSVQYYSENL